MIQILILAILILTNAFFAASEIAFISLKDAKIDIMVKEGNSKAKKIKAMLENPSKFLATIQIGITLAGFLSSAFASESFASELAPLLNKYIPIISISAWNSISIILITIILSYFTLVFGELVPKRIGMKYCEKISLFSITIIKSVSIITAPFVKFLTFSTNIISKLFGVTGNDEEIVTEEEIRMMIDVGQEKGTIKLDEKNMLNNIFEFNDKVVSEIMIPRTEMYALDMNLSISNVIEELMGNSRYSRIPIYDTTIDKINGILYIKDILSFTKNKNSKIKKIAKQAYFVPETKPVNQLFDELRKNRKQIAIIVDEYGGTSGMVTMEDILEEIVGEIYDEYDEVKNTWKSIDENTFILSGSMNIYEVEKVLDIKIEDGDYDTLSGYLLEKLGKIPSEKESPLIETLDINYKIEKIKNKRIIKVKACKNNPEKNI